jgi:hypothetical protein
MSPVLYARVPEALKQALEAYGSTRGLTLTRAAVELLEQGLRASREERSLSELEATLAACRSGREQAQARLKEAELRLQGARAREQLTVATYASLAERTRQELASCPGCREPVRGSDLLVSGRCPKCGKALTELLRPAPQAHLEQSEYLALLGALGVLVGLALATSEASAG